MCGRFTIAKEIAELENYVLNRYEINSLNNDFIIPDYNVSPGNNVISVINDGKNYRIGLLRWGYLPPFPIKDKTGFINARSETIFEKPSFKNAILKQRCIIIADGYYEWNKDKQPMRIITDGSLFAMSGIWNATIDDNGKKIYTVAIITTNANDDVSAVHDRMPVILNKEDELVWLNPNSKINELKDVLKPYLGKTDMYPVSKEVNYNKNNYKTLINSIL